MHLIRHADTLCRMKTSIILVCFIIGFKIHLALTKHQAQPLKVIIPTDFLSISTRNHKCVCVILTFFKKKPISLKKYVIVYCTLVVGYFLKKCTIYLTCLLLHSFTRLGEVNVIFTLILVKPVIFLVFYQL